MEQTLFIRGLAAPAGHTASTGLVAGALWAALAGPSTKRVLQLVATFTGVVTLHTLWNTFSGPIPFVILAAISLGWVFWALHRYKAVNEHHPGRAPATL